MRSAARWHHLNVERGGEKLSRLCRDGRHDLPGWRSAQDGCSAECFRGGAHFTYIPERTHFDLYTTVEGGKEDRRGWFIEIGAEMYAIASQDSHWKASDDGVRALLMLPGRSWN